MFGKIFKKIQAKNGQIESSKKREIVTRFAPSPTGFLHIGGARTALFNFLFTKQKTGKIILRIEDTDQERNREEFTRGILESLKWLELKFDETKKQSENFPIHKKYLKKLISEGKAYISQEEAKKEGQRGEVIRFKNPKRVVTFQDLIRGEIKTDTSDLGDFIIAKSLDEPIFHFSNVVDDMTSGVTTIIRGEDHIANTPRQILIWEAIGERSLPSYAHIPLIFASDKTKLSKRRHGVEVSIEYYRDRGYLPEAMINFLAFLGWNPGGEQEIYSLSELIQIFSLEKVQKSPAVFNIQKLNWFNHEYIQKQTEAEQLTYLKKFLPEAEKFSEKLLEKLRPMIVERLDYYGQLQEMSAAGEFAYYLETPTIEDPTKIIWKKSNQEDTVNNLEDVLKILEKFADVDLGKEANLEKVWSEIQTLTKEKGTGDVLWPLRYALSARDKSPDPKFLLSVLGIAEAKKRISQALEKLKNN